MLGRHKQGGHVRKVRKDEVSSEVCAGSGRGREKNVLDRWKSMCSSPHRREQGMPVERRASMAGAEGTRGTLCKARQQGQTIQSPTGR